MRPGARVLSDNSLINRNVRRDDLISFYVPATRLADENGLRGLANMILVGKILKETGICDTSEMEQALSKTVSERKKDLYNANLRALEIVFNAL
jgi:2-oxoglutarate ferredoxin oxidoreductase subunit gamma